MSYVKENQPMKIPGPIGLVDVAKAALGQDVRDASGDRSDAKSDKEGAFQKAAQGMFQAVGLQREMAQTDYAMANIEGLLGVLPPLLGDAMGPLVTMGPVSFPDVHPMAGYPAGPVATMPPQGVPIPYPHLGGAAGPVDTMGILSQTRSLLTGVAEQLRGSRSSGSSLSIEDALVHELAKLAAGAESDLKEIAGQIDQNNDLKGAIRDLVRDLREGKKDGEDGIKGLMTKVQEVCQHVARVSAEDKKTKTDAIGRTKE